MQYPIPKEDINGWRCCVVEFRKSKLGHTALRLRGRLCKRAARADYINPYVLVGLVQPIAFFQLYNKFVFFLS